LSSTKKKICLNRFDFDLLSTDIPNETLYYSVLIHHNNRWNKCRY